MKEKIGDVDIKDFNKIQLQVSVMCGIVTAEVSETVRGGDKIRQLHSNTVHLSMGF